MNNMFKDWQFWKPIIIMGGGSISYFTILYFLPAKLSLILSLGAFVVYFGYILFMLGQSNYKYKKSEMERNYKNLTGKDLDEQ